jgi:hypothetical protein
MGKITQSKSITASRKNADPIGNKMGLGDELESLKIAKLKGNQLENSAPRSKKMQKAEDEEVSFYTFHIFLFDHSSLD